MEAETRVLELENRIHAMESRIIELEEETENLSERIEENRMDIHTLFKVIKRKFPKEAL